MVTEHSPGFPVDQVGSAVLTWWPVASSPPCLSLGCLRSRYPANALMAHRSGARKSKIRVPARLGSGETSLPGLQTATFWLCPHVSPPSWAPPSRAHLNVITSPRPLLQVALHWGGGLGFQHMNSVFSKSLPLPLGSLPQSRGHGGT